VVLPEVCFDHGGFIQLTKGSNSLNPPYKNSGETDGSEEVSRQAIVSRCNAPEVLQSLEGVFDAPSFRLEALAEAEPPFSVAAIGDFGLVSAVLEPKA
jgi:hypothetical protein